jgi:predicted nucleic acid-binding protein
VIILAPIAYFEVIRGLQKRGDARGFQAMEEVRRSSLYIEMSEQIWAEAARIWVAAVRVKRGIEDADVLLAALASTEGATIVTDNVRHFTALGLPLENWATPKT